MRQVDNINTNTHHSGRRKKLCNPVTLLLGDIKPEFEIKDSQEDVPASQEDHRQRTRGPRPQKFLHVDVHVIVRVAVRSENATYVREGG